MMKFLLKTILLLTLLAALAACQQPTQAPNATPTAGQVETQDAPTSAPAATATTGAGPVATDYPATAPTATAQAPGEAYPADGATPGTGGDYPPPASGVPVLENRSIVKATLVERGTDPQVAGFERLTVNILESAAAEGMPSRTDDLIGEQIFFFVEPANLPELQPGDTFTAEVSFRGDESGGRFYATKIEKQ